MRVLLEAGADTELRYHRRGETVLYGAVQGRKEAIVQALVDAGANPDAANYWVKTPRMWAEHAGLAHLFSGIPERAPTVPAPRIESAEHLADHYVSLSNTLTSRIPDTSESERSW